MEPMGNFHSLYFRREREALFSLGGFWSGITPVMAILKFGAGKDEK